MQTTEQELPSKPGSLLEQIKNGGQLTHTGGKPGLFRKMENII
jgi:hypothetical protein